MQDRIPLYPGRVKLIPVNGQANTFDMVRADEPTEAGTPLNKATLLSDATAADYGFGNDAVPDDIFAAAKHSLDRKMPGEVGDILTTSRTDLGEKWLLCNGAPVSGAVYPTLAELLKGAPNDLSSVSVSTDTTLFVKDIDSGDGYFCILATIGGYPYAVYTNNPAGEWNYEQISTDAYDLDIVRYKNGMWVAAGVDVANGLLVRFTTTAPGAGWTKYTSEISAGTTYTSYVLTGLEYGDGLWVFCGHNRTADTGVIACVLSCDTISGTFVPANASASYNTNAHDIIFAEDKWVVCGGAISPSNYGRVWYASDPTGTWTQVSTAPSGASRAGINKKIRYNNGTWVTLFYYTGSPSMEIFTTTTVTSQWTSYKSIAGSCVPVTLEYANGWWVAVGNYSSKGTYAYKSQDLATWEQIGGTAYSQYMIAAAASDTEIVLCGQKAYSNTDTSGLHVLYSSMSALPTITVDKGYAYIKALEG